MFFEVALHIENASVGLKACSSKLKVKLCKSIGICRSLLRSYNKVHTVFFIYDRCILSAGVPHTPGKIC